MQQDNEEQNIQMITPKQEHSPIFSPIISTFSLPPKMPPTTNITTISNTIPINSNLLSFLNKLYFDNSYRSCYGNVHPSLHTLAIKTIFLKEFTTKVGDKRIVLQYSLNQSAINILKHYF